MSKRQSGLVKKPVHRTILHAARGLIALTAAFALIVAPLIVIATHGPAAHMAAAAMTVQTGGDIGAHGHSHDHDHHHGDGVAEQGHEGGSFASHNPADHDHQLQALICRAENGPGQMPDRARCALSDAFRHMAPEGPMRPPRPV